MKALTETLHLQTFPLLGNTLYAQLTASSIRIVRHFPLMHPSQLFIILTSQAFGSKSFPCWNLFQNELIWSISAVFQEPPDNTTERFQYANCPPPPPPSIRWLTCFQAWLQFVKVFRSNQLKQRLEQVHIWKAWHQHQRLGEEKDIRSQSHCAVAISGTVYACAAS